MLPHELANLKIQQHRQLQIDRVKASRSYGKKRSSSQTSAHVKTNEPANLIHPDDVSAAKVIALARSVGLAGVRPNPAAASERAAKRHEHPDDREAAEIIALARSIGLKGFEKPESAQSVANENPNANAPAGSDNPDDGSDVIALARKHGLKGFVK